MKIFISWSGERSKALAIALREWLPLVLHYVEPWLSEADIEAGERWAQSVATELAASNFGIICVTSENITSPWVLFEAGALTKSLETSCVIPLLLDLEFSDISGPLAQFQAKKLSKTGVDEVIQSIQKAAADEAIPKDRSRQLFDALWSELQSKLDVIPDDAPAERHMRPQHEILEELVSSVRALDSRMREVEDIAGGIPRRSKSHKFERMMHPMMIREMSHIIGRKKNNPIGILMLASMFKDDFPWLYEIGAEAYHAVKNGRADARDSFYSFRRATEFIMHGKFPIEEFGLDRRMIDRAFHEMERYDSNFEEETDQENENNEDSR